MATHTPSILGAATKPDDSGNVYQEPAAINLQSNDRYPVMVWVFKDSSTRIKLGGVFQIPQNYVGTPKIGVVVAAVPTTEHGDSSLTTHRLRTVKVLTHQPIRNQLERL
jgi:hypothetical protein